MSIEVTYRRVTQEDFDRLVADPEAALVEFYPLLRFPDNPERLLEYMKAEEENGQVFRLGKEWHALHFLLSGEPDLNKPVPPPLGNVVLGGTPTQIEATYGMVRSLSTEEVRSVAEALKITTVEDLTQRFNSADFNAHRIYPNPRPTGWNDQELESLLELYPRFVDFFTRAAKAGDMVLLSSD